MSNFTTYQQVVQMFENACTAHIAIKQFSEGSIDKLNSFSQDSLYPYVFLRPIQSTGMELNNNGLSGIRSLNFELFVLDIPELTDSNTLQLQSQTEIYLYDIISYFNLGTSQQDSYLILNSISPLYEAFQDRVCGWVANVTYKGIGVLDFCNFPSLT
jgi:hypothetical protein